DGDVGIFGLRAATRKARAIEQNGALYGLRPGASQQQRDIGPQPSAGYRGAAKTLEGRVGVGHQKLAGIASSDRHLRVAVSREVERIDRAGPGCIAVGQYRR